MLTSILAAYGIGENLCTIQPFGSGLINYTWKITSGNDEFILQRINKNVFKDPQAIADNINLIGKYLQQYHSDYFFVHPVGTTDNKLLVHDSEEFFRLMPFVKDSLTYDVAENPSIAFEAARQFGLFIRLLSDMDAAALKTTLPDFHNLSLRYQQFETSLEQGNKDRINRSSQIIDFIKGHRSIVDTYKRIKKSASFKIRATHHDTKISNVLFDGKGKGVCVIDLDTTMPGYFISDVGDMMRTYLSPVSEEEQDLSKILIREDYFEAISKGYLEQMGNELSGEEKKHFVFAGSFMIYMQALRFLTDYINNDAYYGAKTEDHNFMRASNQATLLQRYLEEQDILENIVRSLLK